MNVTTAPRMGFCTRIVLLVALGAALQAASAPGLEAQLTGRVLDQAGTPIQEVAVEAWESTRRIATRLTDANGAFTFPAAIAARTSALYAYRIGFRGDRIQVTPGSTGPVEIRLDSEAISLPSVEVTTAREFCPQDDQRAARDLWAGAGTRYAQGLDSMGVATYLDARRGTATRDELGVPFPAGEAEEQRGSSFLLRVSWGRRIDREGYAYPVRRPTAEGSNDSWVYAPLEADLAPHFISPLFGRLHTLTLQSVDETGARIAFCPRDTNRPGIYGTLHLAADTSLAAVEWFFRTPEPQEEAGGRAVFAPVSSGRTSPYLLPSEGVVWRRSPEGGFQQIHERYEGWIVAPGDSVPFLPSRKSSSTPGR